MEGLFNPVTILLHTVNALILLVAVYFFLYKPVRSFMQKREAKVNGQLDEAQQLNDQARAALTKSEQRLNDTDREVAGRLTEGQKRMREQQGQMLAEARAAGEQIIAKAQAEADAILKRTHDSMQRQAADLAVEIASKVLEREVRPSDHHALIADFLKKVG